MFHRPHGTPGLLGLSIVTSRPQRISAPTQALTAAQVCAQAPE